MSHRRYDWLFDRWVVIAQDRDQRPDDFKQDTASPASDPVSCPFCPGNEHLTPADLLTIRRSEYGLGPDSIEPANISNRSSGEPKHDWQVRVVPNRFPIVMPSWKAFELGTPSQLSSIDDVDDVASFASSKLPGPNDFFVKQPTAGYHEVIIETPEHNQFFSDLSEREIQAIFDAYVIRLNDLQSRNEIDYISIFKNNGAMAGASLQHLHSQLIALNFTPPMLSAAAARAGRYYQQNGECYFCEQLDAELKAEERVLAVTDSFAVVCPFASRFAGTIKIQPTHHANSFRNTTMELRLEMAQLLLAALRSLEEILPGAAFNYVLNEPPSFLSESVWHWSLDVFMRTAQPAGFEWNTDCFVNSLPPEKLAARLRPKFARHLEQLKRDSPSDYKIATS